MGTEAEHPLPLAPGDVVAGKYVVVRTIGRGGMGTVVEATHKALGQRVAIKILHAHDTAHDEAVERFLREARAAASLTSDHVVRVFDVGTHDSGLPYMVMELLEGVDLGELIEKRGATSIADAVRWVRQAAEAVAEAHAAGIVHRDLKPSNLFLVRPSAGHRSARIKVVDFGISKQGNVPGGSMPTLTGPRSVMGSPSYMSPEQVRSTKTVDARTDVWSLGVILHELLTGRTAFDGESLGDVFAKIREEPLAPATVTRPGVPPALQAVLDRCLERDRERRFADASELAEALRAVVVDPGLDDVGPTDAGRAGASQATTAFELVPASRSSVPVSMTEPSWARPRRAGRRRLAMGMAIGGALVAIGAAGLLAGGDADAVPPASAGREEIPFRLEVEPPPPAVVPATTAPVEVTPVTSASASPSTSAPAAPPRASSRPRVGGGAPRVDAPRPGPPASSAAPPASAPRPLPRHAPPDELGI